METNYAPSRKYLWDPWFLEAEGKFHMFHLQSDRDGKPDDRHHNSVSIGHAVSDDLIKWQELPIALKSGENGSWDDVSLWTGSAIIKDKKCYLFYTGRNHEEFWVQRIGVAVSQDFKQWKKYSGNSILEADEKFYHMENAKNKLEVAPAFRDPFVFKDPKNNIYYAAITARTAGMVQEYNGCIALAKSTNLLDWQLLPPLLAPGRYDEMEVPQIIFHENRYYLFFSASTKCYGLHCYFSNDLFGTYQPVNGNGVILDDEGLPGLRLIKKRGDSFIALGWTNIDENGNFIGRLSDLMYIRIEGDKVVAFNSPQ